MKCKRTSDGRSHDHHPLQIMRQQAVKAVREGQPVESVAAAFGVNKRSVFFVGWPLLLTAVKTHCWLNRFQVSLQN